MQVVSGLMHNQVLQRNKKNKNETYLTVKSTVNTLLRIRVERDSTPLPGLGSKVIGKIKEGVARLRFSEIPTGGPYNVFLQFVGDGGEIHKELCFKNILVGDVWILAGQSNMQGFGLLKDAVSPTRAVRAFYMNDRWDTAKDCIHNLWQSVDKVHADINDGAQFNRKKYFGTGPGVSFGQVMSSLTSVPQGVISCAHGGTSLKQWSPALKKKGGDSLYGAMLRRFHKNGSNVAGVVWYQGEQDATSQDYKHYTKRMKKFVDSMRKDFSIPKLPFILAQLASVHISYDSDTLLRSKSWNSIQEQQRVLPDLIEKVAVVPTVDLELDDRIHISGKSQKRLGKRLANAAFSLINNQRKFDIELGTVKLNKNKYSDFVDIEIGFKNVFGDLTSMGRPSGFAILEPNGNILDVIYRIDLTKRKVILRTSLLPNSRRNIEIYYGYGFSPYCNITDGTDRALPVFGPYRIRICP